MTKEQHELLKIMADSKGYVACDGKHRADAHALEKQGFAEWRGSSWGSQFWEVTDAGRSAIQGSKQ